MALLIELCGCCRTNKPQSGLFSRHYYSTGDEKLQVLLILPPTGQKTLPLGGGAPYHACFLPGLIRTRRDRTRAARINMASRAMVQIWPAKWRGRVYRSRR